MKKRIERRFLHFLSSIWVPLFQRKAHEKEDWERILTSSSIVSPRTVSEKSSWKRGLRESIVPTIFACSPSNTFQRKAHEKEDWELNPSTSLHLWRIFLVSEKSSWKRGLRADSRSSRQFALGSYVSEKSSWKRGLRDVQYGCGNITAARFVSEKSSWKRGLRADDALLNTTYRILLVSEKSSWKRGLRVLQPQIFLSSIYIGFREKLMKKRIESWINWLFAVPGTPRFQRKAHEKEDWENILVSASSHSYTSFREKLMKKRIERRTFLWLFHALCVSRFREKLMKKRIERLLLDLLLSTSFFLSFREKLMKKRIESPL